VLDYRLLFFAITAVTAGSAAVLPAEADRELLSDFAVVISNAVVRVGVGTDVVVDLNVNAGLFLGLAYGSLPGGLADAPRCEWRSTTWTAFSRGVVANVDVKE
jgi:hypothetical protein